jgi:sugar phosphate isomerase/epimerase
VVTWRAIRGHVVHVHVKDSVSVPSARHPFSYVLPGEGEFPMTPLKAELRAANFSGPVSLEWERMWHPYLPPLDEALTVAAARGWW